MSATEAAHTSGRQDLGSTVTEDTRLSVESLSSLTGFPLQFIKSELMLEGKTLSVKELRSKVLSYLDSTDKLIKQ